MKSNEFSIIKLEYGTKVMQSNNIHIIENRVRYMMYGVHPVIKTNKNKPLKSNKKSKTKGRNVDILV
jgi:hypothetical protein